jgi:hypothetical protein
VVFDEEVKWSWGCDKINIEFIIEHMEGDEVITQRKILSVSLFFRFPERKLNWCAR